MTGKFVLGNKSGLVPSIQRLIPKLLITYKIKNKLSLGIFFLLKTDFTKLPQFSSLLHLVKLGFNFSWIIIISVEISPVSMLFSILL